MRALIVLLTLGPIAACARPDNAVRWADGVIVSAGAQPGYAIKQVVEKRGPISLIGDDGSVCRTSRQRLAATGLGSWISCNWTLPVLDSTEIATLSH
jgi:hypothetical protein